MRVCVRRFVFEEVARVGLSLRRLVYVACLLFVALAPAAAPQSRSRARTLALAPTTLEEGRASIATTLRSCAVGVHTYCYVCARLASDHSRSSVLGRLLHRSSPLHRESARVCVRAITVIHLSHAFSR